MTVNKEAKILTYENKILRDYFCKIFLSDWHCCTLDEIKKFNSKFPEVY